MLWGTNLLFGGWSVLSPDGTKLAYTEWTGSSSHTLSVLEVETTRVLLTRSGVASTSPGECSFSADSHFVVWEEAGSGGIENGMFVPRLCLNRRGYSRGSTGEVWLIPGDSGKAGEQRDRERDLRCPALPESEG